MNAVIARHTAAGEVPTLLLHSCCGPCSSATLEQLTAHFRVTVFYFNPNIHPEAEYRHRKAEQERYLREISSAQEVGFRAGGYDPARFFAAVQGLEEEPEGGQRCRVCFALRLRETGELAAREGFDYFTTTLSVSPHKDAQALNEIGKRISEEVGVPYLYSDFKKRNGYLRSIRLAEEHHLYRQDYCGCVFSLRERDARHAEAAPGDEALPAGADAG